MTISCKRRSVVPEPAYDRAMMRRATLLALLLATLPIAPAQARPHRPALRLAGLSGLPAQAAPGDTFKVRGRVAVRRARARRVTMTVALVGGRTLGRKVLRRLR